MEIEHIRKELQHLLRNVTQYSEDFSEGKKISPLEISIVLEKINKIQEKLITLRYLAEMREKEPKLIENVQEPVSITKNDHPKMDKHINPQPIGTDNLEHVGMENNLDPSESAIPKLIDSFTLNDRYLYANELFNKDMNAFNNLIKAIDNSASLNEAKELLSPLNWNDDNEHVLSFQTLIERRFL